MNLDSLCKMCNLGEIINSEKITGGLMHKMYKVETNSGIYAIKILNPEIMKRDNVFINYEVSEKISNLAKANGIPVSSAKLFDGQYIIKFEESYFMVFDYIDGKVLKDNEIKLTNCEKIGEILGQVHNLNFESLNLDSTIEEDRYTIKWKELLNIAKQKNIKYFKLLEENIVNFSSVFDKCMEAFNNSNNSLTICHRDMDPKNVMWSNNEPIIIDWESAKLSNPNRELIETALNWSGFISNEFKEEKFSSLIKGYKKYRKVDRINWNEIILGNLVGRFGWLDYNLKRSLGVNSKDNEEITLAENEVIKVIDEINRYIDMIPAIEKLIAR